jgi:ABC-2 type transport system permease protein
MIPVLVAEWTKLRTLPSTLWTMLVVGITALGGSLILAAASSSAQRSPFDPVTGTFIAWGEYPVLGVGVLGALSVTNEYTNAQIRTTFTAVPRRLRVLWAKALVVGALVLIVMSVLAWTAFGVTDVIHSIHHQPISLAAPGVARSVTMAGASMAAAAVLAVGIGAQVRHTVGAVITFPAVVFLPLSLLTVPWSWGAAIGRYGLLAAAYQLVSPIPHHDLLPVWAAVLVLLAWPFAALVSAAALLTRQDV